MTIFKRTLSTTLLILCGLLSITSFVNAQAQLPAAGAAAAGAGAAAGPAAPAAGIGASAAVNAAVTTTFQTNAPAGYYDEEKKGVPAILPRCAFDPYGCVGENADINLFVTLGINFAKFIFAIIGTVAFVMFVYGGFTMILSFGSAEKFKKGKDILVAAVVGMIIAFGAYLIVNFILNVLQVGSDFRIL